MLPTISVLILGAAALSSIEANSGFLIGESFAITVIENPLGLETPTPKRELSLLVNFLVSYFFVGLYFVGEFVVVMPWAPY